MDHQEPEPAWVLAAPLIFIMLVLVRPVVEEIVFRGLLQGWCQKQRWGGEVVCGISMANIATSIVFTGLHFFTHAWLMAALVFIPSLIFGYFRDRYDGWLLPCIILHCYFNAGYFLMYPPAY